MAVYCFGEFELNEDSRGLRLAGNEIEVQPLVFDFLALLLRYQDRALSKAELFDALWPGVTVTEASLQGAASLARGVLRQARMSIAPNLPGSGYRLCLDLPAASDEGAIPGPAAAMTATADSPPKPPLRQEICSCTASDGIRIAYAEVGAGPPLLKMANWLNHLEFDWQSPIWSICCTRWPRSIAKSATMRAATGCRWTSMTSRSMPSCAIWKAWSKQPASNDSRCLVFRRAAPSRLPMPASIPSASATWCSTADLPRPPQARLAGRNRAGRCGAYADASWLGTGKPGVSPDLHDELRAPWHARADALVQRPAEEHGFGRERHPHQAGLREH